MTTALAYALADAGLIEAPPVVRRLPSPDQRRSASKRMWLLANGLATPEMTKRRQKVIDSCRERAKQWRWEAYDSDGACVVWCILDLGRNVAVLTWPSGLTEEFDLLSETDAQRLRNVVDERPTLATRVEGRTRV